MLVTGRPIILMPMSTLAEIEAAVPSLNPQELERLEARLREVRQRSTATPRPGMQTDLAEFAGSLRLNADPLDWQCRVRGEWE